MSASESVGRPRARARVRLMTLALVFLLGLFVARLPTLAQNSVRGDALDPVSDVYALLMRRYVDPPKADELQKGAIAGMLEALDDRYAEYIPPDEQQEFAKQMTGRFVGIGCQVEMRDGWLTVVSPLEDSPALHAGVMANDRVVKIGDQSTLGKTVDQCIALLTGQPGTPVEITVQRDGRETVFRMNRQQIVNRSVRGFRRLTDGSGRWDFVLDPKTKIVYVRMSQFTPTSPVELLEALRSAEASAGGVGGLVLDLRNNPGGFMEAAIEIADLFLDDGVIMSIRGREGPEEVFNASRAGTLPAFPVAVLVNGISASASEIVAGALQDHDRAVVIGQRSYGKGLVQTVHPLAHLPKAEVKFTTQRYYLPSKRSIQRADESTQWGVDPNAGFYVPMNDSELTAWVLWQRDHDILRSDAAREAAAVNGIASSGATIERWDDPEWIESSAKDRQLAAALRAVTGRLSTGAWKGLGDAQEQHGQIATAELKSLETIRKRLTKEFLRLDKRIETLEKVAETGAKPEPPKDLWPDALDLSDGRIRVFDRDGKMVASMKITGRDVERWLAAADVVPEVGAAEPKSGDDGRSEPPRSPRGEK